MRVKEENEKAGLKLNIKKTKIMASSPITSWQIEGGKVEAVTDFFFLGSKITVNGTATIKLRHLFLGRKAMTNLEGILKCRDITLLTKVCIVKAMTHVHLLLIHVNVWQKLPHCCKVISLQSKQIN